MNSRALIIIDRNVVFLNNVFCSLHTIHQITPSLLIIAGFITALREEGDERESVSLLAIGY